MRVLGALLQSVQVAGDAYLAVVDVRVFGLGSIYSSALGELRRTSPISSIVAYEEHFCSGFMAYALVQERVIAALGLGDRLLARLTASAHNWTICEATYSYSYSERGFI